MKHILFYFFLLIFPFITFSQEQFGQTLFGNVVNELLGHRPAFSADGNRMVILDNIDESGSIVGHARVFDLINNTWTQIGQDLPFHAVGPLHQMNVSISDDGNIVAVSSMGNSPTVLESGSIKVYQYINTTWTQIGQEIIPLSIGEFFAENISLSNDGTTLAAGAASFDNNGSNSGYVRVFKLVNNQWIDKGSMLEGSAYSNFGRDVSLSSDGNTLVCSAPGNVSNAAGYVKIFEFINNDWIETGIINEVLNSEQIGYRVILTPDANTIVLSTYNSELGNLTGQVRIYEKIENSWIQKGSGFSGLEEQDFLGEEISISDDGTILAIGAPRHDFEGENMGYINLYKYVNSDWVLFGEQIRGANNNDYVGHNFTLSSDGTRLAVGFYLDDTNATNSGRLITYDLTSALSINKFNSINFKLYPNPTQNQFVIQLDDFFDLKKVTIFNTIGQVVLISEEKRINTSKLLSGTYFVEILTNLGKASKKLIIEY